MKKNKDEGKNWRVRKKELKKKEEEAKKTGR